MRKLNLAIVKRLKKTVTPEGSEPTSGTDVENLRAFLSFVVLSALERQMDMIHNGGFKPQIEVLTASEIFALTRVDGNDSDESDETAELAEAAATVRLICTEPGWISANSGTETGFSITI